MVNKHICLAPVLCLPSIAGMQYLTSPACFHLWSSLLMSVYTSVRMTYHTMFTCFSMFSLTQMTLRHEDGDDETQLPPSARKDRRRASVGTTNERRGLERRRSRRHSLQNSRGHASAPASPSSPHPHASSFLPFGGQRIEDISERWGCLRLVTFIKLTNWSWDLQDCDGFTGNSLTHVGFRISVLEGAEKRFLN